MTQMKMELKKITLMVVLCATVAYGQNWPWTHVCRDKFCYKIDASEAGGEEGYAQAVCKLMCADDGNLWPLPTGPVIVLKSITPFLLTNLRFNNANSSEHAVWLDTIQTIFNSHMRKMDPSDGSPLKSKANDLKAAADNLLIVTTHVTSASKDITLDTDESYTLTVSFDSVATLITASISAPTYFGARHALETLSQLIAYDDVNNCYQVLSDVQISDKPVFKYRGIHLDTSRNFMPITLLRSVIDGMSYSKLNMFHLHLTDTHSYPLESTNPKLTQYGAYSPQKIYSKIEMQELVQYAKIRGVKIVAEFDAPAHVGNGWQWGPSEGLGKLVVCENQEPWYDFCVQPPCGQLNIANENIYTILEQVYQDYMEIFDKDLFHMGGDEVDFRCYNTSQEITDFMIAQGINRDEAGFIQLWNRFQVRALGLAMTTSENSDLQAILWTSHLTNQDYIEQYVDKDRYIIHLWSTGDDPIIPFLIDHGYRTIFSNYDAWYMDCGFQAWIGNGHNWCSPYKGWQTVYENSPQKIYAVTAGEDAAQEAVDSGLILGGATALWSEQTDENTAEGRIWPRGAALAERLWTNPTTSWEDALRRMVDNRERMVERGIRADGLTPEWCHQNENQCPGPQSVLAQEKKSSEATSLILTPIYVITGLISLALIRV